MNTKIYLITNIDGEPNKVYIGKTNCLHNISKTAGGYIWEFKLNNSKICQPSQSI